MKLEYASQDVIGEDFQYSIITRFSILEKEGDDPLSFVVEVLKSSYFTEDCLPEWIKIEKPTGVLQSAFHLDAIQPNHFKQVSPAELLQFFVKEVNDPSWGDDRGSFTSMLKELEPLMFDWARPFDIFLISQDWFAEDNPVLRYGDIPGLIVYYYLIVIIDFDANRLTIIEMGYD